MASTTLETMRQLYEDLDALEMGIAGTIGMRPATKKHAILNEHVVAKGIVVAQQTASRILVAHRDADGLRRQELASMTGPGMLESFDAAIASMTEFHKRHPDPPPADPITASLQPTVRFSGEEVHGRCLDLVAFHTRWLNTLEAPPTAQPYVAFLRTFHETRTAASSVEGAALTDPDTLLKSRHYKAYVRDLASYLVDFHRRAAPLLSVAHLLQPLADTCSAEQGLPSDAGTAAASSGSDPGLDLGLYTDAGALEALGGDALKAELSRRGLKAGGSVAQRAARLLAVRGLAPADIPAKHRGKNFGAVQAAAAAAQERAAGSGDEEEGGEGADGEAAQVTHGDAADAGAALDFVSDTLDIPHEHRFPAGEASTRWHEAVVRGMAEVLSDSISATLARVQRKQTRTLDELRADAEAEAEGHAGGAEARAMAQAALLDDSDSEEEAPIYNPKKVPLDWDGKPIPYWLYKLHGLRFAFPCEVCGGTTYHGPKVFQQHFSQRTHAEGMRRLGIPNSAHFHGLSKIADVQALWARVQAEMKETEWNAAADEEFEDSVGNVMNRKTYEDLARQGLL